MIYVAYCTPGPYRQEAEGLLESLRRFDLRFHLQQIPASTSWTAACNYKAPFLRSMCAAYPGTPLVYVDVDARIRQRPTLFEQLDADIAFHLLDGVELLSGTLYLGNTAGTHALLEEWERESRKRPGEWDQKCLQSVVDRGGAWSTAALPESYVSIFDRGRVDPADVVIEHMQASRRLKQ